MHSVKFTEKIFREINSLLVEITVWKFQNFSATQILREIDFRDFRGPKYAILVHLEALKYDFLELF